MGDKNKKPKAVVQVERHKDPKVGAEQSYYGLFPAWRISRMELIDPFGWHKVNDAAQLMDIREKLGHFEKRTWKEIILAHGSPNHAVERYKLCKSAQDRLEAMGLDDTDSLMSLRLTGLQRVWGIMDHNVMLILWWDPDHLVCPSMKKHT